MVEGVLEIGMQKSLKNYKASQNSQFFVFWGFFNKGGNGWCKLWFIESCDTLVCMDHEDILADIPLILSVFKKPQGFPGTSEQCLCSIQCQLCN